MYVYHMDGVAGVRSGLALRSGNLVSMYSHKNDLHTVCAFFVIPQISTKVNPFPLHRLHLLPASVDSATNTRIASSARSAGT